MTPIRLNLKNFMSYGETGGSLLFEGLHVASICGDNGNGKSAILEAITWAVWGKTRASGTRASNEDDLIRTNSEEAEVTFEFLIGDQTFRIVRKRRRGRPTSTVLTQKRETGDFVSVTGGGKREVQQQIIDLLSMTHETFLNSAYLQQGRADEFTRQTADKRKQILAEILGLGRYDFLEARAKEKSKEKKDALSEYEGEIRMLEGSVGRQLNHEEELTDILPKIIEVQSSLVVLEAEVVSRLEIQKSLELDSANLNHQKTDFERVQREIVQNQNDETDREKRLRDASQVLIQKDAIVTDYKALQEFRRRKEEVEPKIERLNAQTMESKSLAASIEVEGEKLKGEHRFAEGELQQILHRVKQSEELLKRIAILQPQCEGGDKITEELAASNAKQAGLQTRFDELMADNKRFSADIKELDELLPFLESEQAACPLCESDLSGGKRELVLNRQLAKKDKLTEDQRILKQTGASVKQELQQAKVEAQEFDRRLSDLRLAQSGIEGLRHQQEALKLQGIDAGAAKARVDELKKSLETETFAAPKRLKLMSLERDLKEMEGVRKEYDAVTIKIGQLKDSEKRHSDLQASEKTVPQIQEDLNQIRLTLTQKRAELELKRGIVEKLAPSRVKLEEILRENAKRNGQIKAFSGERESLNGKKQSLMHLIEDCKRSAEQLKVKNAEKIALEKEMFLYNKLASAFSRKGVQALIIENALPDLQHEANLLLGRMTDDAMQLKFDTTRKTRSSNEEIETLDIQITDDSGPRPYELFSGGEAFRANFAIRIALSRLLARRSGAKLETLILDEGFGTQDGKGREKLVEAIEIIKGDFKKILVITHMEDLKDSFSQRIEVTKDDKGSRIYVI